MVLLFTVLTGYGQLTKAEYFFNTDPGRGNGIPIDLNLTPVLI
jgi:hypothetical protein